MSYVSVLKNIPEFLSQPAGIAAIASVGIHGAIAFILPLMPVESKPKQEPSAAGVGILELSQAEQNRLPQNKSPQISGLPQLPLQSALPLPNFATKPTTLDKLPPSPDSTKVILPPLPQSSGNPNISSLPKSQSLPILPQPNFNSSFNAKAKSGGSYRRFNQNIKLGQSSPLASRSRSTRRITSSPTALPDIPPIQSAPLPPELSSIPAPPPLAAINPQINPTVNNRVSVNQPRVANPQEFIAPTDRNIPKPGDKLTLAGQSLQQWGQQPAKPRKIELPKQPQVNQNVKVAPGNTRTLALAKQFEEVQTRYPNSEIKQPISEVIKTKPGKEGKVEGTLVIDSDGKADYLKFVDRSVSSDLKKATRNYFRKYFKENPIRKNGRSKVYAFTLDFNSNMVNAGESSKPQEKLVNRLRSSKNQETQLNKKPENSSRNVDSVKINSQPSRGAVVVPAVNSAPVKLKPQLEIRTNKLTPTSENNDKPEVVRIRNNRELPKVPATSKPPISNRLRSGKQESELENDTKKVSDSSKKLIQQLRKVKQQRENSN